MSAASSVLTEDQFLCSICLDVFTDPVTIPCGHNFCRDCIAHNWGIHLACECPICKKKFHTRPELQVNTFVSEMVAHFRQSESARSFSEQRAAKPGEVPCDVCTGTKLKALKSCLVCLVSYCEIHLEPHLAAPGLKRHQLIGPVGNLEGRRCTKHDKLLELYCKADQACVCMLCTILDHKAHDVVPLEEEYEGKKAELGKTGAELQRMIQARQLKIQEFKRSVKVSKENADREIAEGALIFTNLKEAIERNQAEVKRMIKKKHRATEKQAEGFIKAMEQEISELKKRKATLEQLSRSEDRLLLLQKLPSLTAAPPTRDWKAVRVRRPSYEEDVRKSVAKLVKTLTSETKRLNVRPRALPEMGGPGRRLGGAGGVGGLGSGGRGARGGGGVGSGGRGGRGGLPFGITTPSLQAPSVGSLPVAAAPPGQLHCQNSTFNFTFN